MGLDPVPGGLVDTHPTRATAVITVPREELIMAATFNTELGGANMELVKLAHASWVEDKNKYNVVF